LPQVSANKSTVVKNGTATMVVAKDTAGVPIIGAKVTAGNTSTTTASAAPTLLLYHKWLTSIACWLCHKYEH